MKTGTAVIGFISMGLIIMGSLFKIQHWPGASVLLLTGIALFSFGFLIKNLVVEVSNKESSGMDKAATGFMTVSLWLLSFGMLFKVQHWPGASPMLILGMISIIFFFLPAMLYKFTKSEKTDRSQGIVAILAVVAGFCMMFAINVSKEVLTAFVRGNTMTLQSNASLLQVNENLQQLVGKNDAPQQQEKALEIREQSKATFDLIAQYKREIITRVDRLPLDMADSLYTLQNMMYKDDYDIPTYILIGSEPATPRTDVGSAVALRDALLNYQATLGDLVSAEETKLNIENALDLGEQPTPYGRPQSWVNAMFFHLPAASVISTLTSLQSSVLSMEAMALNDLLTTNTVEVSGSGQ